MATPISLPAQPRSGEIKPKALRRQGMIPGVLYGKEFTAQSLQFETLPLTRVVFEAGTSQLVEVQIDGTDEPENAFFRQVQRDPVTDHIIHVDLYRVLANVAVRNSVPVELRGEAPITETGANITQLIESVEVECLPFDMPSSLVADISGLDSPSSSLTVADLLIPDGVTLLSDPDTALVQVVLPTMEVEPEVEEAGELAEGEEAAEGEAAEGEDEAPAEE